MTFDLVSFLELTGSAAVLVAVLAGAWGETGRVRLRLAAGAAFWFAVVALLGATGALNLGPRGGTPALGVVVVLPVVALTLAATRVPVLRRRLDSMPLAALIGVNALRILGADFLVLHAAGRLAAPFAPVAGWGDILVGVTAIPLALLVRRGGAGWRAAALAWNVAGLADLLVAVGLGVTSAPGPLQVFHAEPGTGIMTTLPWLLIPGFLVPLFAATHLAVFRRLARLRLELVPAGEGTGASEAFPA